MLVEDHVEPTHAAQPHAALPAADDKHAKNLIEKHPLLFVGGALAAGALVGFLRSPRKSKGLLRGLLGGLAMALVREAVLDRVSSYANSWIDSKSREETASRQALEH